MSGSSSAPRSRPPAYVLALIPTAIGLIVGGAWWGLGEDRGLWVFTPLPVLVIAAAAVISAIAIGTLGVRDLLARSRHLGAAEADARHAAEHRAFLARLDHELKNPLTAILAAAASGGEEAPATITAQARRMGVLVTDLRKLGDLRSAPLESEDVDLEETVRDAVDAAKGAGLGSREFLLTFPKAPWPLPHVCGDADLLYSAIQNVVFNAVKYSNEGASIEIRGSQTDGWVSIEVADTGIGIPAADRDAIWSELGRASNVQGRSGSGLGLALVKVIIERHGGVLRLTSREGVGTSVTISLPARSAL